MTQFNLKDPSLFRQQCFINGQWCDAEDGATIDVDNPSNGEIIGTVPRMKEADTLQAIAAADNALPAWRAKTAGERADLLYAWYNLMMEHQDDLGALMTLEQGKPLAESKGEIAYAASFIKWFAEEARRAYGDTIPGAKPGQHIVVIKQAIGVTAAITPWNFPIAIPAWKIAPALAYGNCVVIKPADLVPGCAWAIADIISRSGFPAGVFNLVMGKGREVGEAIVNDKRVDGVSFTGSVGVGRPVPFM